MTDFFAGLSLLILMLFLAIPMMFAAYLFFMGLFAVVGTVWALIVRPKS